MYVCAHVQTHAPLAVGAEQEVRGAEVAVGGEAGATGGGAADSESAPHDLARNPLRHELLNRVAIIAITPAGCWK